jgi:hypothetical protein
MEGRTPHAPTGGGTLDIAAPTSGSFSGMAIYQAPNLTSGVDISAAGTVYFPHSNVTLSGAVNKASNGTNCLVMVMDEITIDGTDNVLSGDTGNGCATAGLTVPTASAPSRGQLVY